MRRQLLWLGLAGLALLGTLVLGQPWARPVQAAEAAPAAHWIWPSSDPTPGRAVFLRKVVSLDKPVKKAISSTACDNRVILFINGEQILQTNSWENPVRDDVSKKLKQGENVLAARCTNDGGPAGFIFQLDIEFADGSKQTIVSDKTWKGSMEAGGNFRSANFDDSQWKTAHSFGKLGVAPWGNQVVLAPGAVPKITSTTPDNIKVAEGFRVELLYSVPKAVQGSWVSMTADPKGRLIVSDQYGSLYRITPPKGPAESEEDTLVEKLDAPIGDAQGLLFAFESLYVVVNGNAAQGSGLYRLRDTTGDDQFDEVKLLKKFQGGGEHGPHAVRLSPDGKKLFVIAGNHTAPPEGFKQDSAIKNWAEDLLLKRNPDGNGHATGRMAPAGWVAVTDPEGQEWELFCAGFRNPYDMDFNQDGELFTYDADMEWDTGTPWYRPTRINHCVSGGEYGWRFGTGKWPEYYPDSVGAVVDIGLGSPTGIEFGTGAKFPAKYQRALFINDWTYGKVYAVHMQPKGATYTASFETFVEGKPLPTTDITVNPVDGALYFAIGGRRTQSGLYRVTYVGDEDTSPAGPLKDEQAAKAREIRRKLESFHHFEAKGAIDFAWQYLNSPDRALRYAARVAIEHQPVELWDQRALKEDRTTASLQALLALTRSGDASLQPMVLARLNAMPLKTLTEEQLLDALRVYQLAFIRLGQKGSPNNGTGTPLPPPEVTSPVVAKLNPLYPAPSEYVNRELAKLLVFLEAPKVVDRSLELLSQARTQQDQLFYVFVLRNLAKGWSDKQREAYFSFLNLAEKKYQGGNSFRRFIQQFRNDAVATLTPEEKTKFQEAIESKQDVEVVQLETTRQFVHNWQMADILPDLSQVAAGRDFARGKLAFEAAQCAKCHRFAGSGGSTGPDITGVGNRFDSRYLLESLLEPSKAVSDQYETTVVETSQGNLFQGRVMEENDDVVKLQTNPFSLESVTVKKADIEFRENSKVSQMPTGLINVLSKEEILDLIAYLRSGGNPQDPAFASGK